jgi:hypothetical protein
MYNLTYEDTYCRLMYINPLPLSTATFFQSTMGLTTRNANVCVCVCVCVRERERERESKVLTCQLEKE